MIKHSKIEELPTGAHRDTREGKGRYDLIPSKPLERLAKHYEAGATLYGDSNWKKGMKSSRLIDSALRHLFKYKQGLKDEDHLAAALWNIMGMMWNEDYRTDLVDLPDEFERG